MLVLTCGLLNQNPVGLYVVMALGVLVFAVAWRRTEGRCPLEAAVAWCCRSVRDRVDQASSNRR